MVTRRWYSTEYFAFGRCLDLNKNTYFKNKLKRQKIPIQPFELGFYYEVPQSKLWSRFLNIVFEAVLHQFFDGNDG